MAVRKLKKSEQLAPSSRYELLLRLAAGGMGAVYLGIDRSQPGSIYAIKRAHSHLLDEESFRKMFVTEARLASRIRHPNAVGVLAVDESDDELLMVMQYIEGGSLGDLLSAAFENERRVPVAVALRIVVDAARGLHAAHELKADDGSPLGLVHRDVSPQNILVGVDGAAAIVDFGVAKAVSQEFTRTATDVLKGKTAYMAPEYISHRVANAQTDVFSLGVVCWEVIANRRLFRGADEIETIQRLTAATPAPMLSEVAGVDPAVAAIVARALSKDPSKRFTSAREFGEALAQKASAAELLATPSEVAASVQALLGTELQERRALLASVASSLRPAMMPGGSEPSMSLAETLRYDPTSRPYTQPMPPKIADVSSSFPSVIDPPGAAPTMSGLEAPSRASYADPTISDFVPHRFAPPSSASNKAGLWILGGSLLLLIGVGSVFAVTRAKLASSNDVPPTLEAAPTSEPPPPPALDPVSVESLPAATVDAEVRDAPVAEVPSGEVPQNTPIAPPSAQAASSAKARPASLGTAAPGWKPKKNPYEN